jgi:hypothetical protein
VLLRGGGGGR